MKKGLPSGEPFSHKNRGGFLDIILSADNNKTVLILPVLPENMPEMVSVFNNTTFDAIDREINIIGTPALRTVTLQSFFPVKKDYRFIRPGANPDGWIYVDFLQKYTNRKVPIRMVWIDGMEEIVNAAFTIDSFTWRINRVKDIAYTIELKEYIFLNVKKVM